MQVLEVNISNGDFRVLPGYFVAFLASVVFLIVFKRWGNSVTPEGNRVTDFIVDILVLLSAGSVIASISTTPLVSTASQALSGAIHGVRVAEGFTIAGWVILATLVLWMGWMYASKETWGPLIIFGIALQALAIIAPWIDVVLSWWINYPIRLVWNGITWVLFFIPDIRIPV